ncbi:sensor histidine kinase [Campylobacter troglodytis]|uniref:sensor histidine kinase n=1 Tax=Campylobacter troglodytis TaxID=654363 RepID=UPI00115A67FA|nr:HAMP domain-containing sensor histidine kinase [Campylobacter troglodytis]TQR60649.1 sensor histidine kinase [Campylobacter troglodytis]
MSEASWVSRWILVLYLSTTGLFLALLFWIYYDKLYDELLFEKTARLKDEHRTIVLSILNSQYTPINQACDNISSVSSIKFAIIDEKNSTLCSSLDFLPSKLDTSREIYKGVAFYTRIMKSSAFFLGKDEDEELGSGGALRTIIQGEDLSKELFFIRLRVLLYALFSFFAIALIAYLLVKIALKPLANKISMLNSFIKDFTHEINTPLSVILLSIEQLEDQEGIDKTKFTRMKLASKTLSQTYSDLIFFTFPNTVSKEEEKIILKELVAERLEYFRLFFEQKKLSVVVNLKGETSLMANKSKINKMLDNLISNAIKYNKKEGKITVSLDENTLSIKDSGYGIEEKNLNKIFDRYARFNKDQGGFGIGLSLVKSICEEYKIKLSCRSKPGEGSEFILRW